MSSISRVFHSASEAFKHAGSAMVDILKTMEKSFTGAFTQLYTLSVGLAQAIKDGNFKEMALKLVELGAAIGEISQPELLAADVATQTAMKAVTDTVKLASQTCGFKVQPWMNDTVAALGTAASFTSVGSAASAMGTELTANLEGQKGPLQQNFENMASDIGGAHPAANANGETDLEINADHAAQAQTENGTPHTV